MLLASLKSQHESALTFFIHGCAHKPSGNAAHVFFFGGKNPQIGSAVIQRIAEALAFAHDKISALGSCGLQKAHRRPLRKTGHQQGSLLMSGINSRRDIFDHTEHIRALHNYRGRLIIQFFLQSIRINLAGRHIRDFHNRIAVGPTVSPQNLPVFRMHRTGNDHFITIGHFRAKHRGFGRGGSAVVHGCIGNFGAGKTGDHGLIFVDRLKNALADFGLIRRIGRIKFRAPYNMTDDRRDIVMICARAG